MNGKKWGLVSVVIAAVTTGARTIKAKLPRITNKGKLFQNSLIGFLITINALILLAVPVLILLPNNGEAKELPAPTQTQAQTRQAAQIPNNSLTENTTNTSTGADVKSYAVDGTSSSRIGVDVSDHQGVIDWKAVAKNGIEFAFIKIGARGYLGGSIIPDTQYQANIEGAQDAGLQVGVYFFSQAVNEKEAREEADFVLNTLNDRALDYPVVYDFETVSDSKGRINQLSSKQRSLNAQAFCDRIEAAGYTTMLYGNYKDLSYYDYTLLLQYDLWFAEYDVYTPRATYPIAIWQFTSSGRINGINTRVDLNVHFNPDAPRQLPGNVVVHSGTP